MAAIGRSSPPAPRFALGEERAAALRPILAQRRLSLSRMSADGRPQAVRTLRRQGTPPGIYAPKFRWAVARHILRRLSAGESLRAICRDDPAMPTEKTVWNWRRRYPAFADAYSEAVVSARRRALAEQASRDGRRRAEVMAGLHSRTGRVAWNRGLSGYGPQVAEAICVRLRGGATLQDVCRDPAMPCVATVFNWMRAHPEFLAAYRAAREQAFWLIVHEAADAADWQYGRALPEPGQTG